MNPQAPLPWKFERLQPDWDGEASYEVTVNGRLGYIMADPRYYNTALKIEDAAYAVHAANAYPRLIEALRFIAKPALGGKQQQYAAQAILKELGE